MPSVCFYFQLHQPPRLKRYSFFQKGLSHDYFDDEKNRRILSQVVDRCYLPATETILDLVERYEGKFRVAYSLSGQLIEQLLLWEPEIIERFAALAATNCVEFLCESYYHSLASIYCVEEFISQIELHRTTVQRLFGVSPTTFRNTELIYNDSIGQLASRLGFSTVIAEGVKDLLNGRSAQSVYRVPKCNARALLKSYELADDIAFRFSDTHWSGFPLTADKYASWIHSLQSTADVVGLFIDYETFGEHQRESTGIFDFLEDLPRAVLSNPAWSFKTPSEAAQDYPANSELSFATTRSWADEGRDLSAWCGNRMQASAHRQVYELRDVVMRSGDEVLLKVWRKLLCSDHFYYMSTKWHADGDIHSYFNPFESPYEAFISYMNVLADLRERLGLPAIEVRPNL